MDARRPPYGQGCTLREPAAIGVLTCGTAAINRVFSFAARAPRAFPTRVGELIMWAACLRTGWILGRSSMRRTTIRVDKFYGAGVALRGPSAGCPAARARVPGGHSRPPLPRWLPIDDGFAAFSPTWIFRRIPYGFNVLRGCRRFRGFRLLALSA